jgi:hypothetical protein
MPGLKPRPTIGGVGREPGLTPAYDRWRRPALQGRLEPGLNPGLASRWLLGQAQFSTPDTNTAGRSSGQGQRSHPCGS